ncbi:MAG: hypothetical protein QM504_16130, partial [Pseudomonadota bacterium]
MTTANSSGTNPISLTNAEIKKCNEIKDTQVDLAKKRAICLLLIHVGNTYTQAAEQSGLSIGQARYLVMAYRKRGMALFNTVAKPAARTTANKNTVKAKTTT